MNCDLVLREKYPLIIIGGGIAGLTTAIAFARFYTGKEEVPALVLEQNPVVGGMVTSFRREGFLFDTSQLIPDPMDLFEFLGIDLPLKRFEHYFARIFLVGGDRREEIRVPCGIDPFKKSLQKRYPEDSAALERFFAYSENMFRELAYLRLEPNWYEYPKLICRCKKIVRNRAKTFSEYLDRFGFKNPELREVFDVFAAFSGLPAGRAVAMMTVAAMNTSLNACYRPENGFIQLPLALKKKAEDLGCQVMTRTRVQHILSDEKHVTGVKLDNGTVIESEYVVTTADPKVAMMELLGKDVLVNADPAYAKKVESVKMSTSSFTISLGLDETIDLKGLGLDCGYNVITTGGDTFERLFKAFDEDEYHLDVNCFHFAVICPSLTTGGKPTLVLRVVPMPMGNWKTLRDRDYTAYTMKKEKIADFYIGLLEYYLIPDLRDHVLFMDVATPATFERYSGSPTGSNYDMAPYPDNFGLKRLKTRTPIKNLFQPKFSHGIWPAIQAGLQVTDMIFDGRVLGGYSKFPGPKICQSSKKK